MHFFEDTHEHLYAHDERLHDERLFDMDDVEDVQEEEYLTYDEEMERFEQLTNDEQFDDEPFSPEF
jgi:predicted DNA-binding transcriptional regulator YafY